ncbi:right-handed parallel beta-helix repeat-containing protein [Vibrio mangrovi]|uniref:Pectate lyase L n=1 Tax=Vibrio mangrovi TaxID=474394 RepID=A0A1Y6ISN0_9VIBR|nr:right-handed parallel beta-helix repeat-containing protein [Vibrio mangrovi]MDW6001301.1 right-handed parallel beta-helix repeat-containing protein [Vibrio mangrovi]SMS00679.1 Pectate lyase L precursor [Vibrio mangrovi]
MNSFNRITSVLPTLFLLFCSTQISAQTLTIQEDQPGFCSADGDPQETSNSGYTGKGYVNVVNQSDTQVVWQVEVGSAGTYSFDFRYANGSADSRAAHVEINGSRYALPQNSTGGWNRWRTDSLQVYLPAGVVTIHLQSDSSSGLANIDSLTVSGNRVKAAACSGVTPHPLVNSALATRCEGTTSGLNASRIYYVTPNGSPNNSGSSFSSPLDYATALEKVRGGEMVLLQPGTYSVAYRAGNKNTIRLSRSGSNGAPIYVVAADCGRAVFDFSFPQGQWVQNSYGFYMTGDYWYLKGIEVTRAGYQGVYVTGSHNTFENSAFHHNRNSGLEINKGGSYTSVINSDSYRNYDPKKNGGMADGFASKQEQGPGNYFFGCRAWDNSDDGFDTYDSPETVTIEYSWAFQNGIDYWNDSNFSGNGNGFKLGGKKALENNRITHSVAFGNVNKGFDQNSNTGGITLINNFSYHNGINYGFGTSLQSGQRHYFRNNVSLDGSVDIANANARYNSWDNGPSVSTSDYLSLDTSFATVTRHADGTLPFTPLFRLNPGSQLIDAGSNEGLYYAGQAPDLGAFERE